MAAIHRLNPALVKTLKKPGAYNDGGGLYLRVRGPEGRSWAFRYMLGGKARWMGLGAFPEVGLADAREAAKTHRAIKEAGGDPIALKRKAEAERLADEVAANARVTSEKRTFRTVAAKYLALNEGSWRHEAHRRQWYSSLKLHVYPVIGDKPVAGLTNKDVADVLRPIWHDKRATANRVRSRVESIMNHAMAKEWHAGPNPAHLAMLMAFLGKRKKRPAMHYASMPWPEIPGFMKLLAEHGGASALALRWVVLTAARTGEALGATWAEIDREARLWMIPGERTKTLTEHRVPLSDAAMAVLTEAAMLRTSTMPDAPLFPGKLLTKPLSDMSLLMQLRRMKRTDVTAHGMRATFRSWCDDCTVYPHAVCEQALGHKVGTAVEQAYQRSDLLDRRRKLMADWATFCGQPVPVGVVIPSRAEA
jgi:integrase